jgi:hypothetical protein
VPSHADIVRSVTRTSGRDDRSAADAR